MPIIIFLSDSYEKGKEIAKKTADNLDYKYVDRDILGEIAKRHDITESKLLKALDEMPSLFGFSSKTWHQYLVYIQEGTLKELLDDKVICHGLAAHLYVLGGSHVMKVRILMDPEKMAREIASKEGISVEKAYNIVKQQKELRKKWSLRAFNIDETDLSRYDLVINLSQIDDKEAVDMIAKASTYRKFQPMTYSIRCLHDRELASRVKAVLLKRFPDVRVNATNGTVVIEIKALKREKQKKTRIIKEMVGNMAGVNYVEVHIINDMLRQAIETFR
jgi:cytidylate kinase